ncbi:MAG: FecR domain-containing protein [Spirochaetales bacterium]|nr:FecR domain-containing protein [Spirochaetales bacterium]
MRRILLLCLLSVSWNAVAAARSAGLVVQVSGKVFFMRGEKQVAVKNKDIIEESDVLRTEKNGRLTLQFTSGLICQAAGDTTLEIKRLLQLTRGKSVRLSVRGNLALHAEGDYADLTIDTPTAVASVRGTELIVEATDEQAAVLVNSGTVDVSNAKGKFRTAVKAGNKAICTDDAVRTEILDRYEKQKFAIIERFMKFREAQLERVIEERLKLKEKVEQQKTQDRERLEKVKNLE